MRQSSVEAADALTGRPWSDYAGFALWLALAIGTAVRAPELSVLLLPPILHELLAAYTFITRDRPRHVDVPLPTRLIAYGRTLLVIVFVTAANAWAPTWIEPAESKRLVGLGAMLWLSGFILCLWPFWHLRAAFSVEPAARRLVTTGPYALARHPIYASYVLIYVGMFLMRPSLQFLAVLALWSWLALRSMRAEEAVLQAAFPEYGAYKLRVGALGPRVNPPAAIEAS